MRIQEEKTELHKKVPRQISVKVTLLWLYDLLLVYSLSLFLSNATFRLLRFYAEKIYFAPKNGWRAPSPHCLQPCYYIHDVFFMSHIWF